MTALRADDSDKLVHSNGFLEGPRSRWSEFAFTVRVMLEFIRGFRTLHFVGPCVTIFGSARFKENHPYYQLTKEVAARISQLGFTIMTGGGPGIMQAANEGAKSVNGASVGCNIILPFEQKHNPFLDKFVNFRYFFVRKVLLVKYSYAFVIMPGGAGTLDEMFETITLIQTGKISSFPVVLMGVSYWQPMVDFMHKMVAEGTISEKDLELFILTDSVDEAEAHIEKYAVAQFALDRKKESLPKKSRILAEV
jgi:uncharacterized protein (TIGR00730 family)